MCSASRGGASRRALAAIVVGAGALAATGCGSSPEASQSSSQASPRAPIFCFAQSKAADPAVGAAYLAAAKSSVASMTGADKVTVREPFTADTAKQALQAAHKAGCGVIATTSASMAQAAKQEALAHDDVIYEVVGVEPGKKNPANLVPLNLRLDQAAFLAGYAAAGTTRSGILAVVTAATGHSRVAEGFAAGVDFYNQAKGTGIVVQGWNAVAKKATAATSEAEVAAHVGTFLGQKADIILVDADAYSPAAFTALADAKSDASVIFTGRDAWEDLPKSRENLMTSLVPDPGVMVGPMLRLARQDTVRAGTTLGFTPTAGGAHLADFRSWGVRLSDELKKEIDSLRSQLAKGDIVIGDAKA